MNLGTLKQLSIVAGVYRPARLLQRVLIPSKRREFRSDIEFYSQFIQPGDLCFDIGANIGAKTEAFLALGATVVSLEPQPELAREVVARCSGYPGKCFVVQKAVGDQPGEMTLHLRESTGQASLIADWQGIPKGQIVVSVTTLNQLISEYGIPKFCKIDVEGYEPQVLRGVSQKIYAMSLEYHVDDACTELLHKCFEIIRFMGPLEVNATSQKGNDFLFQKWLTPNEFLSNFPANVTPNYWGDIVVRSI